MGWGVISEFIFTKNPNLNTFFLGGGGGGGGGGGDGRGSVARVSKFFLQRIQI